MTNSPAAVSGKKIRSRPFHYGQRQRSLTEAINSLAMQEVHSRRSRLIPDDNAHSYRHGREWSTSHNPDTENFSQFQTAQAEATIKFSQILDHDLGSISHYITQVADGLERELYRTVFALVSATTEKVGNVVQSSGDNAADFMRMLEKIETGCDRYGRATMPTMYLPPGAARKIIEELEKQPDEFHRKVEEIKIIKEKAAIGREADRISRFRW